MSSIRGGGARRSRIFFAPGRGGRNRLYIEGKRRVWPSGKERKKPLIHCEKKRSSSTRPGKGGRREQAGPKQRTKPNLQKRENPQRRFARKKSPSLPHLRKGGGGEDSGVFHLRRSRARSVSQKQTHPAPVGKGGNNVVQRAKRR